jgi:hypothetical protein
MSQSIFAEHASKERSIVPDNAQEIVPNKSQSDTGARAVSFQIIWRFFPRYLAYRAENERR